VAAGETETGTVLDYWTHGTGEAKRPHEWRYLGRASQMYHCVICQLRVTKVSLKEATD